MIKTTVGLRPFRRTGPNLTVESLGDKVLVHNYGHGGSGWSLSWGSSRQAVDNALTNGKGGPVAVIGCGALGMTSALLLQRAGRQVTIYTKDRHPNITSSVATGVWSPDSRICLKSEAPAGFADWWEKTCRTSFRHYQNLLGLPGNPIEWVDTFHATDTPPSEEPDEEGDARADSPEFAHFYQERVSDLTPVSREFKAGQHPFRERYAVQGSTMIYNIPAYTQYLLDEFRMQGGRIVTQEFNTPEELKGLRETTIINCTGLGSQALFGDKKLVPVRGQLSFLIPQPEVHYNFSNASAYTIARRDGIIVGSMNNGRYGSTDLSVDPQQSDDSVDAIAASMAGLATG
ncbi:MAG: FAD dependent oxidoreductase [Puniceicoccaceae bacterium 5H]|nr:MAG: FAD dependent oxidoreductase [Puniceicoccaceae bacterium 5H]